jgi:signal transduction histidine kinase/ligand-binding sensor domain-containing protein
MIMFLSVCRRAWRMAAPSLALAGFVAGLTGRAAPAAPAPLPDYLVDVWGTEDNLPSSSVTSIIQTPDGYLWVGTYDGLVRFDGVRFVTFDPGNTPALSHARIQELFLDARGTLWINTYRGGLTSYRDGVFRREWPDQSWFDLHTVLVSSTSNRVTFVTQFGEVLRRALDSTNSQWDVLAPPGSARPVFQCVGRDGDLWFLSREGRVLRVRNRQFEDLPDQGGLGDKRVFTLAADPQGRVWAGAENEIACWDGRRFEDMSPTNPEPSEKLDPTIVFPTSRGPVWVLAGGRLRQLSGRRWVAEAVAWRGLLGWASGRGMGVHEDRAGGVWFNHYGNGVFHITPDGQFQRLTMRDGLPGDRVGAWSQGRDGGVWLGADRGGLARLRERRFRVIGAAEGLPARTALSVCQDPAGAVWIGTSGGGLCRWVGGRLTAYAVGNMASADFVFSIFPRRGGGLWMSAGDGEDLSQFTDGQVQRAPWVVHGVKSLLTDRAGRLWVGTKSGVGWWSTAGRRSFGTNDGMSVSAVRALVEAPDGTVWCGADDGTLYRCEPTRLQAFRPEGDSGPHPIWSLLADADGTIWTGTFRGGLLRFKDGRFTRFGPRQGLLVDVICQILEDRQGRLWLGTHQGICCVARAALDACADGKTATVGVVRYLDGLPTLECSDGYGPACWRAEDGRLWFTTVKGVVSVDPNELTASSLPPPVVIEDLRVDGESLPQRPGRIVVPPGHKQFEFRFTALSFDAPDRTRFRYRIDGLDNDWVEAETRRTAHYGHLAPNQYHFRVIACNNDGVWNTNGAALSFTVLPHFYETRWFVVLVSALVLGGVAAGVRTAATRKYRRALRRLEQQHAIERDRARIAKDIHDDIGAGLTQITLLSELARREPVQAGSHLERISDSARQLTRAMDEIVWAVDPQHDTFAGMMDYISAFAEDFLRTAGIRCRMDLPTALPEARVDAELRYNLFLALKEALNNVVKHARASEVWLRLRLDAKSFTLIIEDNGQGFQAATGDTTAIGADRLSSGSGLSNLRKRLAAIGGRCLVRSTPNRGTRVEMTLALNGVTSPIVATGLDREGPLG